MLDKLTGPALPSKELLLALESIPLLQDCYSQKVRHYTIEKHTLLVLNEFDKYFSKAAIPISKSLFRLLLALHDTGKPRAFKEGQIANQYIYTIEIINEIRKHLPFSKEDIDLCISVINGDPIGLFLQNKIPLSESKKHIIRMAKRSRFELSSFFKILTIYYQCDIASYTKDAGGFPFLERLFLYEGDNKILDRTEGILKFSSNFEKQYKTLKREIFNE